MQKQFEQIQPERDTLTAAWFILKGHIGIESRQKADPEGTEKEWIEVANECRKIYEQTGTPAQEKLAQAVAMAIMDYYTKLSEQ